MRESLTVYCTGVLTRVCSCSFSLSKSTLSPTTRCVVPVAAHSLRCRFFGNHLNVDGMQLATYQLALTANKTELGTDIVNGLASDGESCGKHAHLCCAVWQACPFMLRTPYVRATH